MFLLSGVQDTDLSVLSQTMAQCCKEIKETVQMLASRHKDIHGSVSKVGKAIDRVSLSSIITPLSLSQSLPFFFLLRNTIFSFFLIISFSYNSFLFSYSLLCFFLSIIFFLKLIPFFFF